MKSGTNTWVITVYKEYGSHGENYTKTFNDEETALTFFEEEIRDEFDYEIEHGLVSDQELQNIIDNKSYAYYSDDKEIYIVLEEIKGYE